MTMMLELARKQPHKQFVFLCPQDIRYMYEMCCSIIVKPVNSLCIIVTVLTTTVLDEL